MSSVQFFEEDELSKAEHRLVALQQETKTDCACVNTSGSEQSASRRGGRVQEDAGIIASFQQEISAFRSGQVGVSQTEPDSSEAEVFDESGF